MMPLPVAVSPEVMRTREELLGCNAAFLWSSMATALTLALDIRFDAGMKK